MDVELAKTALAWQAGNSVAAHYHEGFKAGGHDLPSGGRIRGASEASFSFLFIFLFLFLPPWRLTKEKEDSDGPPGRGPTQNHRHKKAGRDGPAWKFWLFL
jgi:hypothetical protein